MPDLPWNISRLTSNYPILLEMEPRLYKTSLLVVDHRHHFEGRRVGRVLLTADYISEVKPGDRVIIKGSSGKTRDTDDKNLDERYRFCRMSDLEVLLLDDVEVESYVRH